jgi:HD-GYP domain-containing protein (c-di-GMP phosphodiesterase class II)
MSSDRPSGAPSSDPEVAESQPSLATLVRARGSTLLDALELHLPGSRNHADGTASYALAAAAELGLPRERAEAVRETARIHEVGMVYVPVRVLGSETQELETHERALVDAHPAYGAELARGAGIPEDACRWIAATRERFDGSGAGGLAGETIPIESRIIRVACACHRALGRAGSHVAAVQALGAIAGSELDPRATDALAALLERAASSPP